jgi:hypothetical protein
MEVFKVWTFRWQHKLSLTFLKIGKWDEDMNVTDSGLHQFTQ